MTNWSAPFRSGITSASQPLKAKISIPGSKSATNRALILAAISKTPSRLRKPLSSRDADLMVKGLRSLGCKINEIKTTEGFDYEITPQKLSGPCQIDVGNAGTVMRFLPPIASLATGLVHFDGDARSHERPLEPVIKALEQLGISIEHGNKYRLPLTINGSGQINGGEIQIDASASSQFISALLLLGPATKNGLTVKHTGKSLPSMPHIEMTIQMLRKFGAIVEVDQNSWTIRSGELHGQDLTIEPDLSNAGPFMAAAMVCGGSVEILDWPKSTSQPGDQLRDIFAKMGARIEQNGEGLKIFGSGEINGIDIDLHDVGELTPTIAAVAALASSPSTLRGIGHLRLHETDRLAALANEINNLGGDVTEGPGELLIKPTNLVASQIFKSYEDHRMATAGAIIGLAVKDLIVENIETTKKTLPNFPGMWQEMLNGK
ncbi:MAG: 3-phosphoshikimate 1-carboxyvinyltransferase [Actinobacteria bacterium]|jgi:3-phosphoshikimate 1-carboxyvinyltransferase|uniref:3-phosphoshikimate 1-carboxyvinyltransferase n=1 Tax=freshwater metagenome TaxID=449393 RepID=A0A6J6NNS0_9ZZZZ|nr:3-phosphoshikimate 1-carboxyvinyltransferase [Actinomycetota bacterium]MTA46904.1 3-phosphoshikimate 1-carboxyvinyltransferase [Actinomycetota bacterium]